MIVDQGRTHYLPVEYFPDSDRAHVTVAERYYALLPFTIGDHRLSIRPNSKAQYLPLEKAKYIFEQPSRSERRNTSKATPQPETAIQEVCYIYDVHPVVQESRHNTEDMLRATNNDIITSVYGTENYTLLYFYSSQGS